MATLTRTERAQLRRKTGGFATARRWEVRPVKEYLAFATFASRLKAAGKGALIEGGKHWKL
ncbi:MAG: hypothetical protein JNG82_07635 [Opitutaceae bacterium]|nr:hypothetical protein [Opitutaceae bacterium]